MNFFGEPFLRICILSKLWSLTYFLNWLKHFESTSTLPHTLILTPFKRDILNNCVFYIVSKCIKYLLMGKHQYFPDSVSSDLFSSLGKFIKTLMNCTIVLYLSRSAYLIFVLAQCFIFFRCFSLTFSCLKMGIMFFSLMSNVALFSL